MASKESQGEDLFSNAITKSLSVKNRQAADKWQQLVKAIETQKSEKFTEINYNRNKLLNKREELQTRTPSLSDKNPLNVPQQQQPALWKVYDSLIASMTKEKRKIESSVTESITKQTLSSERKKALRKNVSFSLSELQKLAPKSKNEKQSVEELPTEFAEQESLERPWSAFEFTEEEKYINRKLYCSPTSLPSIYLQKPHRPRFRSYDKDDASYRKTIAENEERWKDIHHCRYLRLQQRSATVHDLRSTSAHSAAS